MQDTKAAMATAAVIAARSYENVSFIPVFSACTFGLGFIYHFFVSTPILGNKKGNGIETDSHKLRILSRVHTATAVANAGHVSYIFLQRVPVLYLKYRSHVKIS